VTTPPSPAARDDDRLATVTCRIRAGSLDDEQRGHLATLLIIAALNQVIASLVDPPRDPEPDVIDMHEIVRLLRETYGYAAFVEYSGGATMTLYVGPVDENNRYRAVAGPGAWIDGHPVGYTNDFYVSPDDNGATDTTTVAELGATSVDEIAELIARTARGEVINPQGESES
jgi:hypothetical protein